MKMKKLLLGLLPAAFLWAGCANDFEVAAPWEEIPVVYAIFSPRDTAHYIRLEKAFLDPETSALAIAQIPDSIYYPENAVAVYLQRIGSQTRVQLQRVDGNLEGFAREEGVFATTPNWLYKFKPQTGQELLPGATYRVVIERADGKPAITAQTTLPNNFEFRVPNPAQSPPIIAFAGSLTTSVQWATDTNGVYFNVILRIRYREELANGTTVKRDTLVWEAAKNVERSSSPLGGGNFKGIANLSGAAFFKFLSDNIEPSATLFRYFDGCDITLEGGGREIKTFLEVTSVNSGLTGAEVAPTYSNVSEGFGIVTSKNVAHLNSIRIQAATVDSMNAYGQATRQLNFKY
jgi:hypothetical protein